MKRHRSTEKRKMLKLLGYEPVSCLKSDSREEIWVCRDRSSGSRVIIKYQSAGQDGQLLQNEYHFLKTIEQALPPPPGNYFPKAIEYSETEEGSFLVRNYIPGMSLSEYVETREERAGIPGKKTLEIIREVLKILVFLHGMNPPVIHRDIKPQNIIVESDSPEIKVTLIDFGIARNPERGKKARKEADTLVMGTPYFAPPEQFGYRQTDERSDIYAVGILLRYCLTQEYDEEADRQIDSDIRKIIRKATEFDPKHRYQSADDMLRDVNLLLSDHGAADERLLHENASPRRRTILIPGIILILVLGAFFVAGRLPAREKTGSIETDSSITASDEVYHFSEPLIEAAVREKLGKKDGEITADELARVDAIHIFGKQIYLEEGEFSFYGEHAFPNNVSYRETGSWQENGGISSLKDLSAMPNLREVSLYRQNISDISELTDTEISFLGLGYNPIADLTPLSGNRNIEGLNLSMLSSEVLSVLPKLSSLKKIIAAGMGEIQLAPLKELPISELNLADTWVSDEEVFPEFSGLRKLVLSKLYPGLLGQLKALPLEDLELTHTAGVKLRDLEVLKSLRRLFYDIGVENGTEKLSAETLQFPKMRELILKRVDMESLAALSEMKNLETLEIYDSVCRDYTGINELPSLKLVFATEEQKGEIQKMLEAHASSISIASLILSSDVFRHSFASDELCAPSLFST